MTTAATMTREVMTTSLISIQCKGINYKREHYWQATLEAFRPAELTMETNNSSITTSIFSMNVHAYPYNFSRRRTLNGGLQPGK
eukprot:scaffold216692_cov15-Prasinocladus_malaysianus.AAC.1